MIRRVLVVFTVAAIVLVALVAFALSNLEGWLNDNRDWIADRAAQSLGRPLTFDEVGVSFRRGFGVRVANLRVADDPAYADGDVIAIEEARVGVRLLSALRGRYEISHLTLVRPELRIVKNAQGLNLATLSGHEAPARDRGDAALVALTNIEEGRVVFTDLTSEPPLTVAAERVDCKASDLSRDLPVRFRLAAAVLGAGTPNVEVSGTLGPLDTSQPMRTALELELRTGAVMLAELTRLYESMTGSPTSMRLAGTANAVVAASGTAQALAVEARLDATDAAVTTAGALEKAPGIPLVLEMEATQSDGTLSIERARLRVRNARIDGQGTIVVTAADPSYSLRLTAEPFDVTGWEELLPSLAGLGISGRAAANVALVSPVADGPGAPPTVDGTVVLTDVSVHAAGLPKVDGLTTTVLLHDGGATLPPTGLRVDGSTITVQASVDDLAARYAEFKLASPSLDLSGLAAVRARPSGRDDGDAPDSPAAATVLRDVEVTGSYRGAGSEGASRPQLDARLASASGTWAGAVYRDLRGRVQLEGGRYVFNPLELTAFGGRITAEGLFSPSGGAPAQFNFETRATRVDLAELLASRLVGSDLLLEGALTGKLSVAGHGDDWERIRDALVGGGRIELASGRVKDVNIAEALLEGLTGIPGLSGLISPRVRSRHPALFETGDTPFEDMAGEFSIADGRMTSRDLTLRAEDFSLHGRAEIGLDRSLDTRATFEASEELTATLISEVDAVKYLRGSSGRVQIPFRLRGVLPRVRPEPDADFVRAALERAIVQEILPGILPGLIPGLAPRTEEQGAR